MELPATLVRALAAARRVAVLTGAGISAESGVPTFRDAQTGLWSRFRPEELATPEAFRRDPALVWAWYAWRRELVGSAQPNAGHRALVALERQVAGFTLITQNVDGLHRASGSRNVIELHGNLHRDICLEERIEIPVPERTTGQPPRCPRCGAPMRPDVVWFGESLPPEALAAASEAARTSEVFLSIGTSAVVYPAAELPRLAQRAGALLVEVNRDPTPLTGSADFVLAGRAGEILPALVQAAWPDQGAQ